MVLIGLAVFNVIHPGRFFPSTATDKSIDMYDRLVNADSRTELTPRMAVYNFVTVAV